MKAQYVKCEVEDKELGNIPLLLECGHLCGQLSEQIINTPVSSTTDTCMVKTFNILLTKVAHQNFVEHLTWTLLLL